MNDENAGTLVVGSLYFLVLQTFLGITTLDLKTSIAYLRVSIEMCGYICGSSRTFYHTFLDFVNKNAAEHVAIAAHYAACARPYSHYDLRTKQHLNDAMVQSCKTSDEPFSL